MTYDHWEMHQTWPSLLSDEVHVWCIPLDVNARCYGQCRSLLDDAECKRADRFASQQDRERFVAAHAALRVILARYLQEEPNRLRFVYGAYGKPALDPTFTSVLCFNLAHSHDVGLCAVSDKRDVGVDIERVRPERLDHDVARHFFSVREQEELRSLPEFERVAGFFRCWTRKEAYIKGCGMGLALPLDSFDVPLALALSTELLPVHGRTMDASSWRLQDVSLNERFPGAVAATGDDWHARRLRWTWQESVLSC